MRWINEDLYDKFTAQLKGERILKIGQQQQLVKLNA